MPQSGFLGTNAPFVSDLTLIVELLLFVALCGGVLAQRRQRYRLHDWIQTPVVLLNLLLILFVMVTSFAEQQVLETVPQRPADPYYLVVTLHAGLGLLAGLLALYCLLAGHQILPRHIGRLRYWMWATLALWTAAVMAGVATYVIWYLPAGDPPPVETAGLETAADSTTRSTTLFLQNFTFAPSDVTVVAGTQISWVNRDGAPHNVTFVDGNVTSDDFFQGESFSATLDTPGTYQVYCTLHGSPDGGGMAGTITVLEDSAANAATVAETAPTVSPPASPTPEPTVAPPPLDPLNGNDRSRAPLGLVAFHDSVTPADSVTLLLNGIPSPPTGSTYVAWLLDGENGTRLPLGEAVPDSRGRVALHFTDPEQRNLLGRFDAFEMTLEPRFDDDPTPGPTVFEARQPRHALSLLRQVLVTTGGETAAPAIEARRQAEELLRHVAYLQDAHALLSIADARRHAEHIVNLLEGPAGAHYGDLDGAHAIQDPGNGVGLLPQTTRFRDAVAQAAAASDATAAMRLHASHVELATANTIDWGTGIRDAALAIARGEEIGEIEDAVAVISALSPLLLHGEDRNGDGEIAPVEGGIFTAYQHATYMAALPVYEVR